MATEFLYNYLNEDNALATRVSALEDIMNAEKIAQIHQDSVDAKAAKAQAEEILGDMQGQQNGLFVRYDANAALTDTQKGMARNNIGAAEAASLANLREDMTVYNPDISIWVKGRWVAQNGTSSSTATSNHFTIRTKSGYYLDRDISEITTVEGTTIQYALHAYDYENGETYVGAWSGTEFKTTSYTWFSGKTALHEIRKKYPGYAYRLTVQDASNDQTSLEVDGENGVAWAILFGRLVTSRHSTSIVNLTNDMSDLDSRVESLESYKTVIDANNKGVRLVAGGEYVTMDYGVIEKGYIGADGQNSTANPTKSFRTVDYLPVTAGETIYIYAGEGVKVYVRQYTYNSETDTMTPAEPPTKSRTVPGTTVAEIDSGVTHVRVTILKEGSAALENPFSLDWYVARRSNLDVRLDALEETAGWIPAINKAVNTFAGKWMNRAVDTGAEILIPGEMEKGQLSNGENACGNVQDAAATTKAWRTSAFMPITVEAGDMIVTEAAANCKVWVYFYDKATVEMPAVNLDAVDAVSTVEFSASAGESAQAISNMTGVDLSTIGYYKIVVSTTASRMDSPYDYYWSAGIIRRNKRNVYSEVYGASGYTSSSTELKPMYGSVNKRYTMTQKNGVTEITSDYDDVPMFNRKVCVGNWTAGTDRAIFNVQAYKGDADYSETGSMGDYVAVECPPAYWWESDDGDIRLVSGTKLSGFRPFACLEDPDHPGYCRDKTYLPRYTMGVKYTSGTAHAVSLPGKLNEIGGYPALLSTARTYNNSGAAAYAMLEPADVSFYEATLFSIEFQTKNAQSIMMGVCNFETTETEITRVIDSTNIVISPYVSFVNSSLVNIGTGALRDGTKPNAMIVDCVKCNADGTANSAGTYAKLTIAPWMDENDTTVFAPEVGMKVWARPYGTGEIKAIKTASGCVGAPDSGLYPMMYRGRENIYGNLYRTVADLFALRGMQMVGESDTLYTVTFYKLLDPVDYTGDISNFNQADANHFVKVGTVDSNNYLNAYMKEMCRADGYPDIRLPKVIGDGANSTSYFADGVNVSNTTAKRAVQVGGHYALGGKCGIFAFNAVNAPTTSYAYFGSGLYFKQ